MDSNLFIENSNWRIELNTGGMIDSFTTEEGDLFSFSKGYSAGPCWYGKWDGKQRKIALQRGSARNPVYSGNDGDLHFTLTYGLNGKALTVTAEAENRGHSPFQPDKCGLKLGIDTFMASYPEWLDKTFPTMLRCEKTHFWGYLMSPSGKILALGSPDPIASWSLDYNELGEPGDIKWGGHRIETLNLDLLNRHPLPERHPTGSFQLLPGEKRKWTINLLTLETLKDVQEELSVITRAPLFSLEKTTVEEGCPVEIKIYGGDDTTLKAVGPDGSVAALSLRRQNRLLSCLYTPSRAGVYRLLAENGKGKISEAIISCRKPWSWFLRKAADNASIYKQKASTHAENWYGFFSQFLSRKHFPEWNGFSAARERFDLLYPLMFDADRNEPLVAKHRIQNSTAMISLLVDIYEATGDREALEKAVGLAEWIIATSQKEDGSYRAGETHYTCVIYPAKSLMELLAVEKELAEGDNLWKKRYKRHYMSVKSAMDDLVRRNGNIDTEGELTYEDGMISCMALQLGFFALTCDEPEISPYRDLALKTLEEHRCLTQLVVPDSRMRGGTLRFWEAQYDVHIQPNLLNSPHGWTSWRIYGTWYAYLLTGERDYLVQTMNALGSCVQLIDMETGRLRWAFAADPYIEAVQLAEPLSENDPDSYHEGHTHPLRHKHRSFIMGEQYVDMVSDWQFHNPNDNDVHEIFKCLEEVALTSCYIIEREDGNLEAWNCSVIEEKDSIKVIPSESIVDRLHINLKKKRVVQFLKREHFAEENQMTWL